MFHANAAAADEEPPITCFTNIDDPHQSSHVVGTVNVVGRVQCVFDPTDLPAPVTSLSLRLQLLYGPYPNGTVRSEGDFFNEEQASLSGNTATPCVPGYYYPWAYVTVVFPPNYEPPVGSAQGSTGREEPFISCA
jgi:hypothetical protein